MPEFDAEIFLPSGRTDLAVLRLAGNLDTYSVADLEKKIQGLIQDKRYHIVVNCQKLKFLSSPGMGLFLGTLGEVEKQGGSICFAKISQPEVHDAMSLLGFFDVFPVFEEEWEAVQKSQKGYQQG